MPRSRTSGMTLLEVVLAVAVAGFVLSAATSFLVSISSIWAEREARYFFEDHVDGVNEFLKASFTNAGFEIGSGSSPSQQESDEEDEPNDSEDPQSPNIADPPRVDLNLGKDDENSETEGSGNQTNNLLQTAEAPISWKTTPGAAGFEEPLLSFTLNDAPPLLIGLDQSPSTKVELFLHHDQTHGLSLLWFSNLQEEVEDLSDLRRTLISPLVKELRYIYWDEDFEQWEEVTEPKEGDGDEEYLLPRYLKLVFEYQGETKERILAIPVPMQSALLF